MTPVTNSEIVRRLDDITARIADLVRQLETGYVRRDVAEAESKTTAVLLDGLENEVHGLGKRMDRADENATANRRLAIAGLVYPLIVGVIVALLVFALHR